MEEVYIALDIGGTKILAAAITLDRRIVTRERRDTPVNLEEGLALLRELVVQVADSRRILAIGATCGGPLDYRLGVVSSLHMPKWRNVPLKREMEREFGVPFFVDVDTNAAALAEYRFGGWQSECLMYVTLSTGMGGGLIHQGELYRGSGGAHPEVGHQLVPFLHEHHSSIPCSCGSRGCLEALISGTAIRARFGKPAESLHRTEWEEVATYLGRGLRNIASLYAPDLIVLGGGVALGGGEVLLNVARRELREGLKLVPLPRVELSALGYETSLWGAAALAGCGG